MPDLVLVFLLVSCLSLVSQLLALRHLAVQQARTPSEALAAGGYRRTVLCRVIAATVYVVVAAIQLSGSGTLSFEALVVFTSVQGIWITNSLLDIRIRRSLSQAGKPHA
jgi:hypothetical protein